MWSLVNGCIQIFSGVSCFSSPDKKDRDPDSILKKEKRRRTRKVHFENVTVYYFERQQGFTSVPSEGGSTLGMSDRHSWIRQYSLDEFALEQELIHIEMLREHLKEEKLNSIKLKLTKNGTVESEEANMFTVDDISDEIDMDNTELDKCIFLHPLTTEKRCTLLRSSGVMIDMKENRELQAIRMSRQHCGCDCILFCDPETCACSAAGIPCRRMFFPCGCTKEGCSNSAGRVKFNHDQARTHFLDTIKKFELEKSREQQQPTPTNGFHSETSDLGPPKLFTQSQHTLEYSLSDTVPQATSMHLHAAEEMEEPLDDDEEEDEDNEDKEEEDEENEEENEEESSSMSDCSSQSLTNSDSEDEDEEEDEKRSETFEDMSNVDMLTKSP
uniref:Cysteine/serine-rich nuclear protein 3-like n=1 Tax=Gouania willdenowi TaxID=441366 RepID=A0A8C5H4V0_GOUWI